MQYFAFFLNIACKLNAYYIYNCKRVHARTDSHGKMATTVSDVPLHAFTMHTLVKLSSMSKGMCVVAKREIKSRNRAEEISSHIRGFTTYELKKQVVAKLSTNDKWDMFRYLSHGNVVFPSFDMVALMSSEIRELNGARKTVIKEWTIGNMSQECTFTQTALTCDEFFQLLSDEWDSNYGFDYDDPIDGENVSYGWAAAGVYFNVLNYFHGTCQRTQMFEVGTTKQPPSFFLFDQDESVLDSVLLYLLA